MTDNEIIKALECCCSTQVNACDDCPFYERCYNNNEWLEKEAINLINRQKAEIDAFEELTNKNQQCIKEKNDVIDLQKAEIERLEKGSLKEAMTFNSNTIANVRAEAVKEFAERLKESEYQSSDWSHGEHPYVVEVDDIDNLVKEMVGEG